MEFTYHGLVRYSFGFDNPNHAAALFSMLLPFAILLWFCGDKKWLKAVAIITVTALMTGIVFTYSRAGMLSAVCGSVVFALLYGWRNGIKLKPKHLIFTCGMIMMVLVIVMLSGGSERFVSWLYAPGRSVTNRFELWRNGLHILHDNPFGVGSGMSGKIYTIFYQQPSMTTAYRTMVNSFLTFLIEYGVVAGIILLSFIFTGIIESLIKLKREPSGLKQLFLIALLSSFFCALINGTLSTCFDFCVVSARGSLNVIMQQLLFLLFILELWMLSASLLTVSKVDKIRLSLCCATSVAIVISLLQSGSFLERRRNLSCKVNRYGIVINKESSSNYYSYAVKRELEQDRMIPILTKIIPDCNLYILYKRVNEKQLFPKILCRDDCLQPGGNTERIIIFPSLPPETQPAGIRKIILDRYDEAGVNRQWRYFAEQYNIPLQYESYQM